MSLRTEPQPDTYTRPMSQRSRSVKPAARRPKTAARSKARATRPAPVEPILAARDLVKDYTTGGTVTRALDGVSLDVPPGRFVSVMGPSGSGKSTLLHLLGGLDSPTSGEVSLAGRTLSGLSDKDATLVRRSSIGFVFQFFNLVPVLSVAENVALPMVIGGQKPSGYQARLDEVLALVGIEDTRDKLPSEISGGQQQRTAIARAIMPAPTVLLADEPTGNLDSRTGAQVLTLLRSLNQELGQTTVIVTHDARAAAFGDEVIYIEDGRITAHLDLTAPKRRARRAASDGAAKGGEARAQAVLAWLQELGA
jgi:putative ABC transport system ATP-binding protein